MFEWVHSNKALQTKANIINDIYANGTPLQKKAISVLLESFLFYSGFFTPLWYLGQGKMTNVANVIKLIIRDESIHSTYIGYKGRLAMENLNEEEKQAHIDWVIDIAFTLYENEVEYTKDLYSFNGWVDEVETFLQYNLNKALDNLGIPPIFDTTSADVNSVVLNGLSTTTSNHDFFSQVGDGYLLGEVEAVTDHDFNFINNMFE